MLRLWEELSLASGVRVKARAQCPGPGRMESRVGLHLEEGGAGLQPKDVWDLLGLLAPDC